MDMEKIPAKTQEAAGIEPADVQALTEPEPADEQAGEREALENQYAALQAFDPQAPALDDLLTGEKADALAENLQRTGDLLAAYKLTFFDELQKRGAARAVRAEQLRAEEKAHLVRTQAHGMDMPLVTRETLEAYRVFDPEITVDEVRRYELRERAGRNNIH